MTHVNKCELNLGDLAKDLEHSDDNSDTDFEPVKRKRKKMNTDGKQKTAPISVLTPGTYTLVSETDEQSEAVSCDEIFEVDSIEKVETINITETENSFIVNFDEDDKARGESVASRLASGSAKVGELDGQKVIINISPISQANLVIPESDEKELIYLPHLKPSGSKTTVSKSPFLKFRPPVQAPVAVKTPVTKVQAVKNPVPKVKLPVPKVQAVKHPDKKVKHPIKKVQSVENPPQKVPAVKQPVQKVKAVIHPVQKSQVVQTLVQDVKNLVQISQIGKPLTPKVQNVKDPFQKKQTVKPQVSKPIHQKMKSKYGDFLQELDDIL